MIAILFLNGNHYDKATYSSPKNMHILITRPQKQAESLASLLREQGITDIVIDPLLTIHPSWEQRSALRLALKKSPGLLLITSINGAEALAALIDRRDIPVIAVGEASCKAARLHGFRAINGGENVQALVNFILTHYPPQKTPLLYLSGEIITWDFTDALQKEGFEIERVIVYHAHAATELQHALQQVLIAREPVAALFYSERTARIFSRLVEKEQYTAQIACCTAFTLSNPIALSLRGLQWNAILVAETPTQDALLSLLYRYIKNYGH